MSDLDEALIPIKELATFAERIAGLEKRVEALEKKHAPTKKLTKEEKKERIRKECYTEDGKLKKWFLRG